MPFFRISSWWVVSIVLWMAAIDLRGSEPVHVAVASDPGAADLVAAVTAELSAVNNLLVLDRSDLNKVGAEQALQTAIGSADYSALSIVPADGLILLRSGSDADGLIYARLVAAQPGVVLREVALPQVTDPIAQAKAIVQEFAPYWPKLEAIRKGNSATYSLLSLRFDVDSPARRQMERQFNILLASRISAEPDCLVLERWRLNDAVFEKALNAQRLSPFWTGSSLIDGSLQEKGGAIVAVLRLRSPTAAEVTITDQDSPENLPLLVNRLADKMRQKPGGSTTWKPAEEAAHFAALGKWCLDNKLFDQGAEAIESALALGDTSRTTHMLQVKAYDMEAYPDDLRGIYIAADNFRVAKLEPSTMPLRVAAATRAAQLVRDYFGQYRVYQPGSTKDDPEDPARLAVATLNTVLRILCAAYENDYAHSHPDELADLRQQIQPLIADLSADKDLSSGLAAAHHALVDYRAYYAGLWNEKPEDTLTFYRNALQAGGDDSVWVREQIFQATPQRQPFLDQPDGVPQPASPSWVRMAAPWVAAWDGRTPDQIQQLWQSFIQKLAASPDLLDQCDAMKFEVCSDQTEAARDKVGLRFIDLLQKHPEILSGARRREFCAGEQCLLGTLNQKATKDQRPALVQLVVDLMHQHVPLTAGWIEAMTDFIYGPYGNDSAPKLLAALDDYSAWCEKQDPREDGIMRALDRLRATIYRAQPALIPTVSAPADSLTISQFWKPDFSPEAQPNDPQSFVDPSTLVVQGQAAWVMTLLRPGKIVGFDTSTMKTIQAIDVPSDLVPRQHTSRAHHRYLEVTPDWFVLGAESMALLCARGNEQWTKLDVPPTSYKPRWTGGELYLLYDADRGGRASPLFADDPVAAGSGVIEVSLPGKQCQDLVSSRRIPPQNALDGQPLGKPIDIWAKATGLRLSFYDQPIYTATAQKNDWKPLPGPLIRRGKTTSSGFLVEEGFKGGHYGSLVLYGDAAPQVLLSDEGTAQWNFPGSTAFDMGHAMLFSCPILRGHDLCIFTLLKTGPAAGEVPYLIYFAQGSKEEVPIPLSFDYSQVNEQNSSVPRPPTFSFEACSPSENGILIPHPLHRGFWLLPWSAIDAYRAKLANSPAGAAVKTN